MVAPDLKSRIFGYEDSLRVCAKWCAGSDPVAQEPDQDCLRTYRDDCGKLLACTAGEPDGKTTCLAG